MTDDFTCPPLFAILASTLCQACVPIRPASQFIPTLKEYTMTTLPRVSAASFNLRLIIFAITILTATSFTTTPAFATDVTTYHNDIARTGQNLAETILTLNNVNSTSFGKLFTMPVDGIIDAEPLYLSSVAIPNQGTHNVLYAVTENDSVYAFDADTGDQLWQVSLLKNGQTPSDDHGCGQISPQIGITATPVIDTTSGPHGTMYVVSMTMDKRGNYFQHLHALDITTGAEEFGGPVGINARYPGTGENSKDGYV
jgi:outer membrane protein assembly factor BamB